MNDALAMADDTQPDDDLKYWADVGRARKDPQTGQQMPADEGEQREFCTSVQDKQRAYFDAARSNGMLADWIAAFAAFHGLDPDQFSTAAAHSLGYEGDELEFVRLRINIVRTYIQRQATMVLSQPPTLKTKVSNNDASSQLSAKLGDDILGYSFKRATKGQKLRDAVIGAGVVGTGYGHLRWDPMGGDVVEVNQPQNDNAGQPLVDPETGKQALLKQSVKSGAPTLSVGYPWTVFQEPEEQDVSMWRAARCVDNKHNLIATYAKGNAELARKIMHADTSDEYDFAELFRYVGMASANKDRCTTIHFYHRRCAAMPQGRYTIMLGTIILWDGPCPVADGIPIAEMCPAKFIMTTFGYAPSMDLLAIQDALNQLVSDRLSNAATFGRTSMAIEKGSEIVADDVASGQRAIWYPQGGNPPTFINGAQLTTSADTLTVYLHKLLDDVSGQNAASRGDPEANVKSGQFAALLHTVASEYMSYWQESVDTFVETLGNYMLDMFQTYGETTFLYEVTGLDNRTYVKEFTKQDVAGFRGAIVETVSPMLRNTAGRLEIFTQLKDFAPEDRAACWQFIDTGRSEAFMKLDRNSELYIQRENERMLKGEPCQVNEFDDPTKHFPQHWAEEQALWAASEPDLQAIDRLHQHNMQHIVAYSGMHPIAAMLLKIPAPPMLPGNPAFMFAGQLAEAQASISMLTGGMAPPPQGQPTEPQPGEAGSGRPVGAKSASDMKPKQVGPGDPNSTGAAAPGGSGIDSSGVPLPKPANPPPEMQSNA